MELVFFNNAGKVQQRIVASELPHYKVVRKCIRNNRIDHWNTSSESSELRYEKKGWHPNEITGIAHFLGVVSGKLPSGHVVNSKSGGNWTKFEEMYFSALEEVEKDIEKNPIRKDW